jgi:hypothetical protein
MPSTKLFTGISGNASSPNVPLERARGGGIKPLTMIGEGTWGGGTLTLQISPDGGTTWVSTTVTLTDDGVVGVSNIIGTHARLNLAGATSPSLDGWLFY